MIWLLTGIIIILIGIIIWIFRVLRNYSNQLGNLSSKNAIGEIRIPENRLIKTLAPSVQSIFDRNNTYYQKQQQRELEIQQVLTDLNKQVMTPLSVATGYTEVLHSIGMDKNHQLMLEKIDRSLDEVGHYVDYQREYLFILQKKFEQHKEVVNFSKLLKKSLMNYFDSLEKQDFTFSIQIADDCTIMADREVLQRVLFHLLENVRKHGADYLKLRLAIHGDVAILEISNGLEKRITEPKMVRAAFKEGKPKNIAEGKALGLVIAAQLLDLMEWQKSLEIGADKFTVVVQFPLAEAETKG